MTRKGVTAPGGCAAGEAGTGQRLLPAGSDTDAQQLSQPVSGSASRCPDTGCARGPTPWDADTPTHPPRHARPRGQLPQAADPASPAPVTPGERGMGVSGRLACHHGRVLWRGRFRFPQFPAARSRGGWLADVPHASLRHLLIRLGVSRTSYTNSTSASAHGAGIRPHSPPDTAVTPLTNPHARQQPFSLSLSLEIRLPSARTSQEAERNPRSSHTSPSRPRHDTEQRAHAAEAHPLRKALLPADTSRGQGRCGSVLGSRRDHAPGRPRPAPPPFRDREHARPPGQAEVSATPCVAVPAAGAPSTQLRVLSAPPARSPHEARGHGQHWAAAGDCAGHRVTARVWWPPGLTQGSPESARTPPSACVLHPAHSSRGVNGGRPSRQALPGAGSRSRRPSPKAWHRPSCSPRGVSRLRFPRAAGLVLLSRLYKRREVFSQMQEVKAQTRSKRSHTQTHPPVFTVTTRACNTVRVTSVTQCGDIARTITRTAHRRCLHMENCDAQMSQVWGGSPWEAGADDAGRCGTLTPVKCSVAGRTAACLTSKRSWARRGVRSPEPSLPRGS